MSHRWKALVLTAALGLLAGSCTVDTYCPDCTDGQVRTDAGDDGGLPRDQIVATGGGGSVRHCSVASVGGADAGNIAVLFTIVASTLVWRRRRS